MSTDETNPLIDLCIKAVGFLGGSGVVFAGYAVISLTV